MKNIKKGEELTSNYLYCRHHFYGASYRQKHLADIWHLNCHCNRCQDSTDFGTMSDAVRCRKCKGDKLMQIETNPDSNWVCRTCYATQSAEEVGATLAFWWNIINQTSKYDIKLLLELYSNLQVVFNENHFYILEVKLRIIENIGETNGNFY